MVPSRTLRLKSVIFTSPSEETRRCSEVKEETLVQTKVTPSHANYRPKKALGVCYVERGYISSGKITMKEVLRVNVGHSGCHLLGVSKDFHVREFPSM